LEDKELWRNFETPEGASNLLKLQSIHRFSSTADAVEDLTAIQEGKLSKGLKKFLTDEISGVVDGAEGKKGKGKGKAGGIDGLIVADPKLGGAILKKLPNLNIVTDRSVNDLYRGIRSQLATLLTLNDEASIGPKDLENMNLGLSHTLSRYKLKFSPDKVDTMIVQAIALLDELDKEINIYAMRVKEWYGWHFPEMAKIINDNMAYARIIKAMGYRTNAVNTDFSSILPEELEELLKAAAKLSMGTEISPSDLMHIQHLCEQVIQITQYRTELSEYLRNRMLAIAPNLTALIGELVGARLIAHAGSLMTLAKFPASTVQILGAEKALFRALKSKAPTPKYGIIFHASLVGTAPQQLKGKMARMTSTKAALSIRHDALSDADSKALETSGQLGLDSRVRLEARLAQLEQAIGIQSNRRATTNVNGMKKFEMKGTGAGYNTAADSLIPTASAVNGSKPLIEVVGGDKETEKEKKKKEKKEKKRKREEDEAGETPKAAPADSDAEDEEDVDKKERKRRKKEKKAAEAAAAAAAAAATSAVTDATTETPKSEKKKKKRQAEDGVNGDVSMTAGDVEEVDGDEKKKKKKDKKGKAEQAGDVAGEEPPKKKKKRKSEAGEA